MEKHPISDPVIRQVVNALSAAIALASVHEPSLRSSFMAAANALDDELNVIPDGETDDIENES